LKTGDWPLLMMLFAPDPALVWKVQEMLPIGPGGFLSRAIDM